MLASASGPVVSGFDWFMQYIILYPLGFIGMFLAVKWWFSDTGNSTSHREIKWRNTRRHKR